MHRKSRNIALLSTLVVLVAGATASAASAAMQFEWKVNGAPFAEGASKPVTMKDKGTGLVHLEVGEAGSAIKLSSNKLKLASGEGYGTNLRGGKPGTAEGALELEGVKVETSSKCQIKGEKIKTVGLRAEIVEGAEEKVGTGKAEVLFQPKTGSLVTSFVIENHGSEHCSLAGTYAIVGSFFAGISPQKSEAAVDSLLLEPKSAERIDVKEYKNSQNEFKKAGMQFAGKAAPLTGEVELELASKEVFGAF